jgi:hypothetical protein
MKKGHYTILYVVAVVIAIITAFWQVVPANIAATVLAVLGVAIGLMNVSGSESSRFLVASVALIVAELVSRGLENIILIGPYIPPVLLNVTYLVAPAAIVVALKTINEAAREL